MVKLYTTHCPQCRVLEKLLVDKKIEFETVEDVGLMKTKGIMSVPQLEIDGELMNMRKAMKWINE